jgi:hypothetical protein
MIEQRVARGLAHGAFLLTLGAAGWLTFTCQRPLTTGLDSAFYYQVARHVSEGAGLVTSVSLYHQGLTPLPHATNVYPAWPLLLGGVGRWIGMERAAHLLPRLLYLLDLVLAYLLVRRVGARFGKPALGHAAIALLAFAPAFFVSTALPYTEGLGVALGLCTLGAIDVATTSTRPRRQVVGAALAGVLAGAAYATRFQLIGFVVALPFVPWPRPRRVLLGVVAVSAALVPIALVGLQLASLPGFTPAMLFDFSAWRAAPDLPPFEFTAKTAGAIEFPGPTARKASQWPSTRFTRIPTSPRSAPPRYASCQRPSCSSRAGTTRCVRFGAHGSRS